MNEFFEVPLVWRRKRMRGALSCSYQGCSQVTTTHLSCLPFSLRYLISGFGVVHIRHEEVEIYDKYCLPMSV